MYQVRAVIIQSIQEANSIRHIPQHMTDTVIPIGITVSVMVCA